MKKFNYLEFIKKLVSFSPRQIEGETKTINFLVSKFVENKIEYNMHNFSIQLPRTIKEDLKADGKSVKCEACSLVGGKIKDKGKIISSLFSSIVSQNDANINFNPKCNFISKSNYYFAPSVAVDHKGLNQVIKAKKVSGEVRIKKTIHKTGNILAGNIKNPKNICFAHFDSINAGAIDNASGVAVMMSAIINDRDVLENNLFVFSACEELSYNKPVYWGYGFRQFEKKYYKLLNQAEKIIVIDSVGNGNPVLIKDPSLIKLGFPIKNMNKWINKIGFISGDFEHLMSVYHSNLDDGRGIKISFLENTEKMFLKQIS